MANVVLRPKNLTKAQRTQRRSLFLAGALGDSTWRDAVIAGLGDLDVDVFDPRSDILETPRAEELAGGAIGGAMDWLVRNAVEADVVVFWLPRDVRAPVALLQLGYLAAKRGGPKRGSSVIVAPTGPAHDLVRAFVAIARVQLVDTIDDVLRVARYQLARTDL